MITRVARISSKRLLTRQRRRRIWAFSLMVGHRGLLEHS